MVVLPPKDPAYFDLAFLICEPAEVYHKQSKDHLSSHQLGDCRPGRHAAGRSALAAAVAPHFAAGGPRGGPRN